ncbi:hypothetical protein [Microbacterium gorillae]|uniref:hypothetical protein n=1 Tax=Microbacterium gorillae TaxID=1231063 RepID=UPI003D99B06F
MTAFTMPHFWWQNDQTWTTREGVVIPVEDLTPSHRDRILRMITSRSTCRVRDDMSGRSFHFLPEPDDTGADEVYHFTDDEIFDRMPIVRRLRELQAADAADAAQREACRTRAAAKVRKAASHTKRSAVRDGQIADIESMVRVAAESADRSALEAIQQTLVQILSEAPGVSFRGRAAVMKRSGAAAGSAGQVSPSR